MKPTPSVEILFPRIQRIKERNNTQKNSLSVTDGERRTEEINLNREQSGQHMDNSNTNIMVKNGPHGEHVENEVANTSVVPYINTSEDSTWKEIGCSHLSTCQGSGISPIAAVIFPCLHRIKERNKRTFVDLEQDNLVSKGHLSRVLKNLIVYI